MVEVAGFAVPRVSFKYHMMRTDQFDPPYIALLNKHIIVQQTMRMPRDRSPLRVRLVLRHYVPRAR